MSFRYMLRLEDGSEAGEVELELPAKVGEEIRVAGNVRARIRAVRESLDPVALVGGRVGQ